MLGESITITVNSVEKTLYRINGGDAYSGEYFLREATGEFRMKVRHSKEKALIRGEKMDRHNVELSHTTWGVAPDDGHTTIVSFTLRNPERADAQEVGYLSDAVAAFCMANEDKLIGWQS